MTARGIWRLWRRVQEHQSLARRGERAAARFLRRRGLRILSRNVRCGQGEIDLVALDGETLVFVEVKSRSEGSLSVDLEKIDGRKRRALGRACRLFLARLSEPAASWRVDGVCVEYRRSPLRPRCVEVRWFPGILELEE
jgi:putative endonuclease